MFEYVSSSAVDAIYSAKSAYERLLRQGISATDRELSRSDDYRRFLMAGMEIMRSGGPSAVGLARSRIVASVDGADTKHFDRLWNGLLPN